MELRPYNLAIETATPPGSVSIGRDNTLLQSCDLPALTKPRHRIDLIPVIDSMCRDLQIAPGQIGQIYVSIGPGSFTGLRIAIATAKTLALVTQAKIVAVPTLDVIAQNAPGPLDQGEKPLKSQQLAACLAMKRDTVFAGVYTWVGGKWLPQAEPRVQGLADLILLAGQGCYLLGHPLPDLEPGLESTIHRLPAELAIAKSSIVWELGREAAADHRFIDQHQLAPLYARPPEAVELWDKRLAENQAGTTP